MAILRIGSEVKGMIRATREALTGTDGVLSGALPSAPSNNFLPVESPFVEMGGSTHLSFIYGRSQYGGDDVVMPCTLSRASFREFIRVKD